MNATVIVPIDRQLDQEPLPLYSSQSVREIECHFAKSCGMDTFFLMERAGASAFRLLLQRWPSARRILVVCGKGNNGGDGYILANLANKAGCEVHILQAVPRAGCPTDANVAFGRLDSAIIVMNDALSINWDCYDVIVDGLLGTGVKGAVKEPLVHLIGMINQHPCPVLSLDVPSGLNADTGHIDNTAIKSDATMAFIALKPGLVTARGLDHCGTVYVDSLGISPRDMASCLPLASLVNLRSSPVAMQARREDSHKGHFGHTMVVGGNTGMSGAAIMAARAALRCGSGLVTVATHEQHASGLPLVQHELMTRAIPENFCDKDGDSLLSVRASNVVVLGPGLGQTEWSRQVWRRVMREDRHLVLDADALNMLAQNQIQKDKWVLTPHPGEAARLLQVSNDSIQADRLTSAQAIVARYGGVCVLKGAGTVVTNGKQHFILRAGNPGMASGGMGDILAGCIGAFLAQGHSTMHSALLAALLHSTAADRVAQKDGQNGLLATDLLPAIRELVNGIF